MYMFSMSVICVPKPCNIYDACLKKWRNKRKQKKKGLWEENELREWNFHNTKAQKLNEGHLA